MAVNYKDPKSISYPPKKWDVVGDSSHWKCIDDPDRDDTTYVNNEPEWNSIKFTERNPLIYINNTRYNIVTDESMLRRQLIDLGALDDRWTTYLGNPETCVAWKIEDLNPSLWARIKLWFKKVFDKMF